MRYIDEKVEASANFINKIWNASRFVLMQIPEDMEVSDIDLSNASMIDKWILKRFNEVLENVTANMEKYEYALVGNELYSFIWDDFCSWYIELSKAGLSSDDETLRRATQSTLVTVLSGIVRMLHPFMPFVTEEIYLAIPHTQESDQSGGLAMCSGCGDERRGNDSDSSADYNDRGSAQSEGGLQPEAEHGHRGHHTGRKR